jgi:hypothetical protein
VDIPATSDNIPGTLVLRDNTGGFDLKPASIVNADVSATAAIAGTKISPNFGSQNVTTSGLGNFRAPSNHWAATSGFFAVGATSLGQLDTHGGFEVTLTSNGYRDNTAGTNLWVSYGANSQNGAAQIALNPEGFITFRTEASKATGSGLGITDRMRITAGGNVGIGTTSPSGRLHVEGGSSYLGDDVFLTKSTASGPYLGSAAAVPLRLGTNGTERIRIHGSGGLSIGTTQAFSVGSGSDDGFHLAPNGTASFSRDDSPTLQLRRRSGNGSIAIFYRDTTNVGTISVTTTATAYNTSSDYRLKQNVEPMVGGLAKLAALAPVTFEFKAEPNVKVDGFIAHEVQAVVPQAVTGEKDGEEMQGLDHSKLVPVLVAAVQELSAKVAALESALELK